VKQAIERAIQEMLAPAIERATKIAVTTSEQIVKKVDYPPFKLLFLLLIVGWYFVWYFTI